MSTNNESYATAMGKHRQGTQMESYLAELCMGKELIIGGTLFAQNEIHKVTGVSLNKQTQSQIDHIAINRKWILLETNGLQMLVVTITY